MMYCVTCIYARDGLVNHLSVIPISIYMCLKNKSAGMIKLLLV